MASIGNDLILYNDSSQTPQTFAPHSKSKGTNANGVAVAQTQFGADDGEIATLGIMSDVAVAGDTWTTPGISLLRVIKAQWRDIVTAIKGTLNTSEIAPAPIVGANVIVLSAKVGAGKFVHLQVINDTTGPMYAVIEDTATTTAPTSGATLAPLRVIEVPAGDGTTANSGTADHAVPFAFVNGCRVLLSTTYRTYTPVTSFAGLISASVI